MPTSRSAPSLTRFAAGFATGLPACPAVSSTRVMKQDTLNENVE
jgi:hypothetical protein